MLYHFTLVGWSSFALNCCRASGVELAAAAASLKPRMFRQRPSAGLCFWITSFTPHSEQHCRDAVGFKLCSSKHLVQVLAAGPGERNGGFGCDEAQRTNHTSRWHHKSSDFHKQEKVYFHLRRGLRTFEQPSVLWPLKWKWNILTLSYWSSASHEQ